MSEHTYELIIIGGGPAGLAAGLYAARDGLDALLFEKATPGGQILLSNEVANYPGFPDYPSGVELARKLEQHVESFALQFRNEEIKSLEMRGKSISMETSAGSYRARTAIVASGAAYRRLGVPGEMEFQGRGVSYCGSCDGPFFREKSLIVVGGGDTAIEEALFLTRFARKVTVVHRRRRLRAGPFLQKQAFANRKIDFRWDCVVDEIRGEGVVRGAVLSNVRNGGLEEFTCDGVFIFIGSTPNTGFVRGALELDEAGCVVTDINMRTSLPGVFAAGDVRKDSVKQVAASVGDGVTAIIHAERYLEVL